MSLHDDLIVAARAWLKNHCRCKIVVSELVTAAGEVPDAIGWTRHGNTYLVECKTSRADFIADAQKFWRRSPEQGMGEFRYFFALPGLISEGDLPTGWGLVELTAKGARVVRRSHAPDCGDCAILIRCKSAWPQRATHRADETRSCAAADDGGSNDGGRIGAA